MDKIIKEIFDKQKYKMGFGHEPKYLYLGRIEYLKLTNSEFFKESAFYNSKIEGAFIFNGMEVIEVLRENHLEIL